MTSPRSTRTREAMINAAERIVADRGLGALTLAEVGRRAGQANKSAATYHFGSREGFIGAVLEQRMGPVDARRRELLDERRGTRRTLSAGDIAELFVLPLAAETIGRADSHYARFLVQVLVDPQLSDLALGHVRAASFRDLREAYRQICPLPSEQVDVRFTSVVGLAVMTLAAWEGRENAPVDPDVVIADLVATCTAVLTATG